MILVKKEPVSYVTNSEQNHVHWIKCYHQLYSIYLLIQGYFSCDPMYQSYLGINSFQNHFTLSFFCYIIICKKKSLFLCNIQCIWLLSLKISFQNWLQVTVKWGGNIFPCPGFKSMKVAIWTKALLIINNILISFFSFFPFCFQVVNRDHSFYFWYSLIDQNNYESGIFVIIYFPRNFVSHLSTLIYLPVFPYIGIYFYQIIFEVIEFLNSPIYFSF